MARHLPKDNLVFFPSLALLDELQEATPSPFFTERVLRRLKQRAERLPCHALESGGATRSSLPSPGDHIVKPPAK